MSDRHCNLYARITDDQVIALEKALDAHERRTGMRVTQAQVTRAGAAQFCRSEGIAFPAFIEKDSAKRRCPRKP